MRNRRDRGVAAGGGELGQLACGLLLFATAEAGEIWREGSYGVGFAAVTRGCLNCCGDGRGFWRF